MELESLILKYQWEIGISLITVVTFLVLVRLVFKKRSGSKQGKHTKKNTTTTTTTTSKKAQESNKSRPGQSSKKGKDKDPTHPTLSFKDDVSCITFSSNGKYFAVGNKDRSIFIYPTQFLVSTVDFLRIGTPYDYPTSCSFSEDSNYLVVSLADTMTVIAYQISDKKIFDGKRYKQVAHFPREHSNTIKSVAIAPNAKFIMTCSEDTEIRVWSMKGQVLATINTNQLRNHMASVSPDSKFMALAAFTSEVKIWEVMFKKDGDFDQVKKVMDLKGHKGSVYCVDFNRESTKAVTVSNDNTWKLWRLDVRYKFGEDPECLQTAHIPIPNPSLVALSPNESVVAVAAGRNKLLIYDTKSGELSATFDCAHLGDITSIAWSVDSKVLASGGTDKLVHTWTVP